MNPSFWQEKLERCPAVRPWLLRAAKHVVAHEALPATLTLGEIPQNKAVRQTLDTLFGGCREERGRLKVRLDEPLRERALWLPLVELLGLTPAPKAAEPIDVLFAQTLRRLKVLHPDNSAFIDTLRRSEQLRRFFKTVPTAPDDLVSLFDVLVSLRTTPAGITLSELGAKCFNDSKALRNGTRRQQLEHLLRLQAGGTDDDAITLFNACGIIENPYTTHVVVYAPFAYRTHEGEWLDWPHRLWLRGEAAILSWKTVRALTAIRFDKPCHTLVTSENAAPFHRLVETHRTALYTEGYPNAAVKTLLRHFAQTGLTCLHWGDTDLDGYRIAEQVARNIPTRMYAPPASAGHLREHLLPLSSEQHQRAEQFLRATADFPYLAELRQTLSHGWLEQEQTIDLFS
ncbi:MAG: Wadjet anti-phage system protein JetD domain-containing protein [bacterium]